MTKRQIKRAYLRDEFSLGEAVQELMLEHFMDWGDALRYLL